MNYRQPFVAITNRIVEPLPTKRTLKLWANFIRIFITVVVLGVIALGSFYSPRRASSQAVKAPARKNHVDQSVAPSALRKPLMKIPTRDAIKDWYGWTLHSTPMFAESVTLYAADCVTPKTAFNLGETVCAKTDGIDLSIANNHYMNWIDSQLNETNGCLLYTSDAADE